MGQGSDSIDSPWGLRPLELQATQSILGLMWGMLGYFRKRQKSQGFPQLLFPLRVRQFRIRIRSHGLRTGKDLSSLIEENIPEKRRWLGFLICVFGGGVGL